MLKLEQKKEDFLFDGKSIKEVIDTLWDKYDTDGNGDLDQEETKIFMKEVMKFLNCNKKISNSQFN